MCISSVSEAPEATVQTEAGPVHSVLRILKGCVEVLGQPKRCFAIGDGKV